MADEKRAAKYAEKQAKKQAIKDEKEAKRVRQKFIGDNALITPVKRITPAIGLNSAMMVEFYERKMAKGDVAIALRKKLESEGRHVEAANVGIDTNSDWQAGFEACCASLEEFRKLTRPYAPKFKNGWEYWVSACMYMEWCDNNPEIKSALAGKTAEWVETEVKRPYMKPAFAQFCGVSERLIRNSNLPHTVGGNTTAVNGNVDYGLLVANDFINMSFKHRLYTNALVGNYDSRIVTKMLDMDVEAERLLNSLDNGKKDGNEAKSIKFEVIDVKSSSDNIQDVEHEDIK